MSVEDASVLPTVSALITDVGNMDVHCNKILLVAALLTSLEPELMLDWRGKGRKRIEGRIGLGWKDRKGCSKTI